MVDERIKKLAHGLVNYSIKTKENENVLIHLTGTDSYILGRELVKEVYKALEEKGYNPVNQIVGYILSGDPTYITSHNDARNIIRKVERDELLEKMVKSYIGLEE